MSLMRSLSVHAGFLVASSALAFYVWTRDEDPVSTNPAEVEVWEGSVEKIEKISFKSHKEADAERKVSLEARRDEQGLYFVASVDKEVASPPPRHPPGVDAGAPPKAKVKREKKRFVAVSQAKELAEELAELKALRRIGKIGKDREEEFGLDKPEGTLTLSMGGKKHSLIIGGRAPGGSDRYAKEQGSGIVYAIPGDIANKVMFAESRLLERELHAFEMQEIDRVKLEKNGKSRELVPVEGKVDGWASVKAPEQLDETAGNWMSKLRRLRVVEYIEDPKPKPSKLVVRVKYYDQGKEVGSLELYEMPPGSKDEAKYLAKTAHSRWFFKVTDTTAEQLQQDLDSVLK